MIDLTDEEIARRQTLAVELLLTSGMIMPDDLTLNYETGDVDIDPLIYQFAGVFAINIITGGIGGASNEMMSAAIADPRAATASHDALWTAISNIAGEVVNRA